VNTPNHFNYRQLTPKLSLLAFCLIAAFVAAQFVPESVQLTATANAMTAKRKKKKPKKVVENPAVTESLGVMEADMTIKAQKDKPFAIDLWLVPKEKQFKGTVTVFMEQTAQMKYEPRVFQIRPGERKTVMATVLGTSCGLAPIQATADNWEDFDAVVDTGFSAKLKTNVIEPIDSGITKTFSIALEDAEGNPVSLDNDVELTLQSSKIKLKTFEDQNWHEQIVLNMKRGTSATPPLNIQSDSLVADKALISAQLQVEDFVVHNADFWIDVKARWYVPLLMAMLGGVAYGVWKMFKESADPKNSLRSFSAIFGGLFAGAFAGALAYFLANWGVLGIKVDTTTLQGFVILGFLFSYVGVDTILKAVTTKEKGKETEDSAGKGAEAH